MERLVAAELRLDVLNYDVIDVQAIAYELSVILAAPIRNVRVLAKVGRMLHVVYQPHAVPDPDICFVEGLPSVNSALVAFQNYRLSASPSSKLWYTRVSEAGRVVCDTMEKLVADDEGQYILRWMKVILAYGLQKELPDEQQQTWIRG